MATGDDDKFEASPSWMDKTNWAPGVPIDSDAIPVLRYQALLGRVYVLQRWKSGASVRGEMPLAELEALVGGGVKEGWYNALGKYLGSEIDLDAEGV